VRSTARNSSARAPRRAVDAPAAANSSGIQPMPRPRSRRPPDSTSIVVACLASTVGETNGRLTTATPSLIREVRAARYPSATIGSSTLRYTGSIPEPSGTSSRWKLHSDAYPKASARSANDPRYRGVAHAPATGAPNPIRMPPP